MTRYSRSKGIAYPAPPTDEPGDGPDRDDERGDDPEQDDDRSSGEPAERASAND